MINKTQRTFRKMRCSCSKNILYFEVILLRRVEIEMTASKNDEVFFFKSSCCPPYCVSLALLCLRKYIVIKYDSCQQWHRLRVSTLQDTQHATENTCWAYLEVPVRTAVLYVERCGFWCCCAFLLGSHACSSIWQPDMSFFIYPANPVLFSRQSGEP